MTNEWLYGLDQCELVPTSFMDYTVPLNTFTDFSKTAINTIYDKGWCSTRELL